MFTLLTAGLGDVVLTDVIKQLVILVSSIMVGSQTLTAAIRGLFNIENSKTVHIINWIIGALAGVGFVAFNGITFGLPLWADYVLGLCAGLMAAAAGNGFYDWEAVKNIFTLIADLFGKVHGDTYYRTAKKAEETE